MKKLIFIIRYLKYLLKSKTRYRIHSDFVFGFINNILRDKTNYSDFPKLWETRNEFANSKDLIETVDFGSMAGDRVYRTNILTLKKIVNGRTHSKSRLELLYRLTKYYEPKNILEFGTAVGISSSYIKSGSPDSNMISMEGCANLAAIANARYDELEISNIELAVGNFDTNIDDVLSKFSTLDFVFFDGNHREEPTLRYYDLCSKYITANSIFVFDDIHWSTGMENAWNTIKKDSRVSVTIDLFWFGIVFFRKGIEKQDFVIRY